MTISYHVDAGSLGRRDSKNVFPTPEMAIECAAIHALRLNRAVSVLEVDTEREVEWGEGNPGAKAHYCLVWPDGSTQKSVGGQNPFKVFLDEHATSGSDDEDSVEQALGLPTYALGSAVGKLDSTLLQLRQHPDSALVERLHRVAASIAGQHERLTARNKAVASAFKVGRQLKVAGGIASVTEVDATTGVVELMVLTGSPHLTEAGYESEFTRFTIEALELAQMIVADQQAEAHHMTPGDVAVLDEKDQVFVLDSADEVYVVLQDGQIKTIPDDVTRIRRMEDAGDNEAKKVKRVWQTFYRALLKFFDVQSIDQLDSEQKSRAFDKARLKWPKVQQQMLQKQKEEEEGEEGEEPAQEEGEQPASQPQQPQASADSWSDKPTMLSYFMDILRNDVEASTKLALSFMSASVRDATKFRAMKQMTKFEGHDLPSNWFAVASLLAEVGKRKSVKANRTMDLTPPRDVQKVAARALDRAAKAGTALPTITSQHAKMLTAGRPLSVEAAERMHLFLTRHRTTAQSEVLWDAWGGHPGKRWVMQVAKTINPR